MTDLSSYLPMIQAHMDATIVDRKSSTQLYGELKDQLGEVPQAQFASFLSQSVANGKLKGYMTKRGPFGGFVPLVPRGKTPSLEIPSDASSVVTALEALNGTEAPETPVEEEPLPALPDITAESADTPDAGAPDAGVVQITSTTRLYSTDCRNWAFQVKSGKVWIPKFYYPTLVEALKITARKLVDAELRQQMFDSVHHIQQAEIKVVALLEQLVQQPPPADL